MTRHPRRLEWRFHAALVALLLLLSLPANTVAQIVVTPGTDPTATLKVAVRWRHIRNASGVGGDAEVWIGSPPLTTAANRTDAHLTWQNGMHVSIKYTEGSLIAAPSGVSRFVGAIAPINYAEITVFRSNGCPSTFQCSGRHLTFDNVLFHGASPPTNSFVLIGPASGPQMQTWKVTGIDFAGSFDLHGIVSWFGPLTGADANYVEVRFGYVPPADAIGPSVSAVTVFPMPVLLNGAATVTATVDDSDHGNSNIQSAQYSLNGGAWLEMEANDGFDSPTERVSAAFAAPPLGISEVCVRGRDALGNVSSAPTCQKFVVSYHIDGFSDPIDNEQVSSVKAGQTVPAKWRLTDANGMPIEDPQSFVRLASYVADCDDFAGDSTLALDEEAPGSSGLQYLGDGYWQFNWKVPKAYAGPSSCRVVFVEFKGSATLGAKFRFPK